MTKPKDKNNAAWYYVLNYTYIHSLSSKLKLYSLLDQS